MNIWAKHVDEFVVVAPLVGKELSVIDASYSHQNMQFISVPSFDLLSVNSTLRTFFKLPILFWTLFKAMQVADHIHLRCPGNVGLLGCLVQILFPKTPKSAKYAGNWDPKSKKPWSYQLQQWILSNTFLTRNMKVLVYGVWDGQSQNIYPFFTASYSEMDKVRLVSKKLHTPIDFVFVGALVKGKNPLYAINMIESLHLKGHQVRLRIYGEGIERKLLENYIETKQLDSIVFLKGNQSTEIIQRAYQESHFVILPSASEGWPKAIAEGMFWGCVPLATKVSCVPFMLDFGNRGLLLTMDLANDSLQMEKIIKNQPLYDSMQHQAATWSQKYTTELFESEILKILK
jgi:glycosyltransferase involved in cell wall biosynthesis